MFADKYLYKNKTEKFIGEFPCSNLKIIVVIPCYREPDILDTLFSLKKCTLPKSCVEVIVLINHSMDDSDKVRDENYQTKKNIDIWIKNNSCKELKFWAVGPVILKKKWAGAGLARKKGMDEAVRRFNYLERENGIIVSLDADTLVEKNYLIEIEKYFKKNDLCVGATIKFNHQKKGLGKRQLQGIELYEKFLSYYKMALQYISYPYPLYTIGSAFAVTALAYVKRGGMNRRKAGEDFYFLQNLVQIGRVGEILTTTVYPSSRVSKRVPFGTGPTIDKWMRGKEDLTRTYNFEAFQKLKMFFERKEQFFKVSKEKYEVILGSLSEEIRAFLIKDEFYKQICDLNKNCSSIDSFKKRFFQKFNAFKIVKFLNFAHENYYQKVDLEEQINLLNSYFED